MQEIHSIVFPHLAEEITTARLMALILSTTKFVTFVSTYNLWFNCYLRRFKFFKLV